MKLSFSLATKSSSKLKSAQNFNSEDNQDSASAAKKEYVTEFDPSKSLSDGLSNKLIIPPMENEWRPHKKMKNLEVPLGSIDPDQRFEVESLSVGSEAPDSNISYGLNLRESTQGESDAGDVIKVQPGDRPRHVSVENALLQKLKDDLDRLPEDRGFEEFSDVPVEGFGAALLAGYGWVEGRGIGKRAKEDVKVVQYERRTAKEGLGFVSDMINSNVSSNGNKKKEKEKPGNKIEGGRYFVGKNVRIVGGRDAGLKGRIVDLPISGDSVVLKVFSRNEEVRVRVRDVADLGSVEEERCLLKLKELKIQGSKDGVGGSSGRGVKDSNGSRKHRESSHEVPRDKKKASKRSHEGGKSDGREVGRSDRREAGRSDRREAEKSNRTTWLISHIRVKFISKEFKGGRLYLKKGEVVDVVGPMTCDISLDEGRELIQGVDQDLLETVVPRRGGTALVLSGKHKGAYGNLVDRDTENATGVLRDLDTHALLNVRFEQIAEYVGDPGDIGY